MSSRPAKVQSLLKLLGTLANPKTCAVVAGAIVAVSSIHMIRKGMKWFCRKRSSTNVDNEMESAANHHERGTQTEAPEDHLLSVQGSSFPVNATSIAETCNSDEGDANATVGKSLSTVPSTDVDQSLITEIASTEDLDNISSLTNETSHKPTVSGCQCSEQKRAGRQMSQCTQPMHPLCQLPICMALLALQKASSCGIYNEIGHVYAQQHTRQEEDVSPIGNHSLFHPGTKPVGANLENTSGNGIIEQSIFKIGELRKSDSDPTKRNTSPSTRHFPWPQTAKNRSSSPQYHLNTFQTQKSDTKENQSGPKLGANAPVKVSGRDSFAGQSSATKKTSDNDVPKDTRNSNMSEAQKQATRKTNVAGSSAEKPKQGSNLQQKRKPKRRGGRRGRNVRRQQYVDLDHPNQVAS